MGKFHLVYYISMGTPSIEASLQMAEAYLAHGVSALQFDLPSRNPYRETLFIRKRMAKAWETYGGYEPFLTALTEFRRKHPDFEMQMVSYEDVILTIGTARYIEFCKQNNIKTCPVEGSSSGACSTAMSICSSWMNRRPCSFRRRWTTSYAA